MATAAASVELPASADAVWALVGGFGSLTDWLPYIPASELGEGGRTRSLANPNGSTIIERLMHFDQDGRTYTYHILKAPFPVTEYYSTLRVSPQGEMGSRVDWSGQFTPDVVTDAQASKLFQKIYDDGLIALASHFSND